VESPSAGGTSAAQVQSKASTVVIEYFMLRRSIGVAEGGYLGSFVRSGYNEGGQLCHEVII